MHSHAQAQAREWQEFDHSLFLRTDEGLAHSVAAFRFHLKSPLRPVTARDGRFTPLLRRLPNLSMPISPDFRDRLDAAFGNDWPGELRAWKIAHAVQDISQARYITEDEREKQQAAVAVANVYSAIRWLRGRPHEQVFPYADQVHGQRVTVACGCVVGELFDHYDRENPSKIMHPHKAEYACENHHRIWHEDWREHHHIVKPSRHLHLV